MTIKYIPALKTGDGDRIIFIGKSHLFDTPDEAMQTQLSDLLSYIPMGLTPSGVFETEIGDDGTANFLHLPFGGPWRSNCAVVSGPSLDEALTREQSA